MTDQNQRSPQHDINEAIKMRILARAAKINGQLLARLAVVADDLDSCNHLAALGGLEGIERELTTIRSVLLLLS